MIIYVLDDGETWTLSEPTAVAITPEQLTRIEGGEKFYHVVPDWDERPDPMCGCMKCTKERFNPDPPEEAEDFFVQAGIAAAEALKLDYIIEHGTEDEVASAMLMQAERMTPNERAALNEARQNLMKFLDNEAKKDYTKSIVDAQNQHANGGK